MGFVSRTGWSGVLMPRQLEIHAKSLHPCYFCILIVGVQMHCKSCWQLHQPFGTQSTVVWSLLGPVYKKWPVSITNNANWSKICFSQSVFFHWLWCTLEQAYGGEYFCFRQHYWIVPLEMHYENLYSLYKCREWISILSKILNGWGRVTGLL